MSLRIGLERALEDPISQEIMQSPVVITKCGHTFQDATIRQWIGDLPSRACPTCDRPIAKADLVRNHAVEDVAGVLHVPEDSLAKTVMKVAERKIGEIVAEGKRVLKEPVKIGKWEVLLTLTGGVFYVAADSFVSSLVKAGPYYINK